MVSMATPEEIAKAIAETQLKMQKQATTSSSYLPNEFTVPVASPEEISQVIAATQKKLKEQSIVRVKYGIYKESRFIYKILNKSLV